ncbi:hypothetical protein PEX2_062660 [Penicillium expansum]|uniref:Uncharacterized protein n=1 Tax=Penicillium expansum TaxID=27334 RepID=A0A0A2JN37_PENEN|nr:hypothetical protein PEX2_062660 [Penicillium expansum]KGO45112.1 hypothetical protein PEXP_091420 [Penicillium expansum]KGO53655.1 hypothetical protein PEX2_062660 [Penicillium expansum]
MPGEILHYLYKHCPQASVHIASSKVALCEKINHNHSSAPQLSGIRSIEAEWYDGEYDRPIRPSSTASYPAQLNDIVYRSHNLESLKLVSIGRWRPLHFSRIRYSDIPPHFERRELEARKNQRGLITLKEGNVLPQVKNIHFDSMRFGPLQSTLWATQLQWQTIKYLSLIAVDWIHLLPKITLPGCFHALENLQMSIPNSHSGYERDCPAYTERVEQFHSFLKELPPLKMFIGYGFPQKTLEVLAECHAKSLQHLRFRYGLGRAKCSENKCTPVSIHNLINLADQLPNLLSLGVNLSLTPDEDLVSIHAIILLLIEAFRHPSR